MTTTKAVREEAINELKKIIQPSDTVYTVLRYVSRSGMRRGIDLYVIRDNKPVWITSRVGNAIGSPQSIKDWREQRGLSVNGCGMDMGFDLVYSLSRVLFHGEPARNGDPTENNDRGYWLKHEWI